MPLPLRTVEPIFVSRGTLPERFPVQNDLEAAANGTLSNVILQLSSLSHHAEELFSDLIRVGTEICTRASNLQARIDRLAVKVVQLDGSHEETASMQDSLNTKPFQSSLAFDQQVVSRTTLSANMSKVYFSCDKPPPLDNLNPYRDDGKDGLKFYTDPGYFFDLWRQEMLKDTEKKAIRKLQSMELQEPHKPKEGGQRHKKRIRQPNLSRDRQKNLAIERGEHFMNNTEYRPPNTPDVVGDGVIYQQDVQHSPQLQQQYQQKGKSLSIDPNKQGYTNYNDQQNYAGNNGNGPPNNAINNDIGQRHYQYANTNLYDQYEAYNQQLLQQQQQQQHPNRYYPQSHMTPPSNYSNSIDGSPNSAYMSPGSRGYANSTPRGSVGSSSINSSMTNGFAFRPNQPPPAPPPNNYGTPQQNASGTPTRQAVRNQHSSSVISSPSTRDALPPPPPPPVENEIVQSYNGHGHHLQNNNIHQSYNQQMHSQQQQHHYGGVPMDRMNSLPPPPLNDDDDDLPPPPPTPDQYHDGLRPHGVPDDHLPPSPPPPPLDDGGHNNHHHHSHSVSSPPPAPSLPINNVNNSMIHNNGNINGGGLIKPAPIVKKKSLLPAAFDGRSELLKAIRDGIELRKVDNKKEPGKEEKSGSTYCDVASILARRVAVEMSDSESNSSEGEDSDAWDEQTSA